MAMRVAECNLEQPSSLGSMVRRYLSWRGELTDASLPEEYDVAYDTGAVFAEVMHMVSELVDIEHATDDILLKAVDSAAKAAFESRASAGVSPAHRSAVLAMQPTISLELLADAAVAEAKLTHRHPEALQTAAAVALLARQLIEGQDLKAACLGTLPYIGADALETQQVLRTFAEHDKVPAASHRDGFSPLVLESALCFLASATCFQEALEESIRFAGPDNFAPVLVGSLGGALFGCSDALLKGLCSDLWPAETIEGPGTPHGVTIRTLNHDHFLQREHRSRIYKLASAYAQLWRS